MRLIWKNVKVPTEIEVSNPYFKTKCKIRISHFDCCLNFNSTKTFPHQANISVALKFKLVLRRLLHSLSRSVKKFRPIFKIFRTFYNKYIIYQDNSTMSNLCSRFCSQEHMKNMVSYVYCKIKK